MARQIFRMNYHHRFHHHHHLFVLRLDLAARDQRLCDVLGKHVVQHLREEERHLGVHVSREDVCVWERG